MSINVLGDVLQVTLENADQEYALVIPGTARLALIQVRDELVEVRFAFAPGKVAGPVEPYATIRKTGQSLAFPKPGDRSGADITVYLASSVPGVKVEALLTKVG